MTIHFDPGRTAPEGPFVPEKHGSVERLAADSPGARDKAGPNAAGVIVAAADQADAAVLKAIGIAEKLFTKAAGDFEELSDRVILGESAELKEAVGQARAMRAAAQTMMDERNRVDKLRKEVGGGMAGAGSLDLDAARDEIGRRLACLRRAGGG